MLFTPEESRFLTDYINAQRSSLGQKFSDALFRKIEQAACFPILAKVWTCEHLDGGGSGTGEIIAVYGDKKKAEALKNERSNFVRIAEEDALMVSPDDCYLLSDRIPYRLDVNLVERKDDLKKEALRMLSPEHLWALGLEDERPEITELTKYPWKQREVTNVENK